MADLIGLLSIQIVFIITFLIARKWPDISKIIFSAFSLRVFLMLIGHYFISLPDSTKDAMGFEWGTWNRAKDGFINVLYNYPGMSMEFYQWLMAFPYSLFGRSILMLQSISLLFGLGCILLGWLLAKKIWGKDIATKVGWIMALFPTLVLYSILTLREVYACFFLLVAMHGIYNWNRNYDYKSIILTMFGFIAGTFFHGGMIFGAFIFGMFVILHSLKKVSNLILSYRTSPKHLFIILLTIGFLQLYTSNKIFIPKIGYFKDAINLDRMRDEVKFRLVGNASYPSWTQINSSSEFIYKGIVRSGYFLFSPFPWDVKSKSHLVGMFDGFIYIILIYYVFRNRKNIWNDPTLKIILLVLVFYFFVFGIGVSNSGAAVRHRSKFFIEILILAAPFIPTFSFSKKKNRF